jgi:basic amino acid/polyamine antiporter, APA family
LLAIALALQGVLWTFEGYANTTTMTEESINPRRVLPRALILGGVALGAAYLVVNAAYLHVLGRDALAGSPLPAADVAERLIGHAGQGIFLVVAIFVALGSLNGAALSAPRVAYALSRSGLAPEPLTRVTRKGTPDLATLWFAAAWTLFAWFGSFEGLVAVSVFIGALANVMVTAALFRLRRGRVGEGEPAAGGAPVVQAPVGGPPAGPRLFHCPAYPVLPLGMLLFWTAFAAAVLYDQKWKVGYGLAVTAAAAPVYLWMKRRQRSREGRPARS